MNDSTKQPTHIVAMDNGIGATGVALFGPDDLVAYEKLPIKSTVNYQKEEQHITRLDVPAYRNILLKWNLPKATTLVVMERPMVNITRFKASLSACRCLEATIIVLEELGLEYCVIDSKVWQQLLLPNVEGSPALKKASLELGRKLFPQFKISKDADSLLIGYYYKNRESLSPPKPVPKPKKIKTL